MTLRTLALCIGLCGATFATSQGLAQSVTDVQAKTPHSAYLQDGRGVIVRNPFGLCWRSGTWTASDAVPGCDGELAPPVAISPIAPAIPAQAAPAPVATPAPPVPKRCDFAFTLGSDEAFSFNKAALSNTAKQRIDAEVLPKLAACAKVDIVLITGHADRLGSQQYNQKLSEKRADAVAAYLKSRGVSADIDTLGAGKTQSVKACDDKLPRSQLIECLAPNRRVVIEGRGLAK
jgi:OmpA-OmpF porin, OOP family